MRHISKFLILVLFSFNVLAGEYDTDPQAQYPQDQTQDTFQFANFIACFMKAMAPELSVGVGQYLAYVDENKCEDSGASANTSSASGGSSVTPPSYAKALTTVTQGANGELNVEALVSLTDEENGTEIPKRIQVIATIYAGPNAEPPYGRWNMDFCASTVGREGSCNDGQGMLRVSGSGIDVFNRWATGYRSGKSVFTASSGLQGYGSAVSEDSVWSGGNSNALFAFAPGVYSLQPDRNSLTKACYNPSTSASGVQYSVWENFLYSPSTRNKITYENPGFYLKSNLSGRTIGNVSYWGVHFWDDASSADQNSGAVLIRADDPAQEFILRKSPGRLERVSTTTTSGLSPIDGIPLTIGFWGYNTGSNGINSLSDTGVNSAKVYQWLSGTTPSSSNVSLKGYWSNSNQSLVFTGYEICGNSGCSQSSFSSALSKSLSDLVGFGITDVHSWLNGVNVSYSFRIAGWSSGTLNPFSLSQIQLIKRSSEILAPSDTSIPSNLVCIGNCPTLSSGNLVDSQSNSWPPTTTVTLNWDSVQGAPLINGTSTPVDWSSTGRGHHYELFDPLNLPTMDCPAAGSATGGYCTDLYKSSSNATYYTWQSGNRWDSYNYLVYRSGANQNQAVSPNPPLNLSYTVPNTTGNSSGYIGKTITIQSPNPGNIWMPGHCVDSLGAEKECSSNTNWVNDVVIPFAANQTGTVTRLNSTGAATSEQYLVKWLKRGVFFASLPSSSCSSLDSSLSLAGGLTLPGISDVNSTVTSIGLPWPSTGFDINPRVIDGILQNN